MGKIMRGGVEFSGNTSVIYRNGIPYLSQGVPDYKLAPKTITMNGIYDPEDDNCNGYSGVVVDVPTQDPPVLTTKTITTNGTYNASADSADGYSQVIVNEPLEARTFTTNGTYTPSGSNVGFSSVSIDVPTGTVRGTLSKDDLSGETMLAGIYSATNIGTATQGEVLSGKTFSSSNGIRLSGTMTNRGAWTGTGTPSGNNQTNVTIPAGYHNGSGYVTCKGQTSYSAGYTAGVNATKASRVTIWTGSVRNNVSVNLSGYSWVYITVGNATYNGCTLLQVGGGGSSAGIYQTVDGGARGYVTVFQATTSAVNAITAWAYDDRAALYLTGIYGIKNLS